MKVSRLCEVSKKEFPTTRQKSEKVKASSEDTFWTDSEDKHISDEEYVTSEGSNEPNSDSESQSNSVYHSEWVPSVDSDRHSIQEEEPDMNHTKRPARIRKAPTCWTCESVSCMAQADPSYYKSSMESSDVDQWKEALGEFAALTSKFEYKKKLNAEDKICRYKVRIVVLGYKQS